MNEVTIRNDSKETYTVSSIDTNDTRPNMHASLQERGYDGNLYTLARVTTGRKKAYTVTCYRTKHGEFVRMM